MHAGDGENFFWFLLDPGADESKEKILLWSAGQMPDVKCLICGRLCPKQDQKQYRERSTATT